LETKIYESILRLGGTIDMTGWWNELPVFLRYLILAWAILSLIVLGYVGFILFQKTLDRTIRNQPSSKGQAQEVDPGVLNKIELLSAYKCYEIFRPDAVIFDQPAKLKINLKANKTPLQKGKIRFEFICRFMGDGNRLGMSSGAGPFKEIEIPPLKPYESSQIRMTIDKINYIERLVNPAILNLIVFDSQDNRKGHKTLYFNIKTQEEARQEVRSKVIFWAVLITFFITVVTFSKTLVIPFLKSILSAIKK